MPSYSQLVRINREDIKRNSISFRQNQQLQLNLYSPLKESFQLRELNERDASILVRIVAMIDRINKNSINYKIFLLEVVQHLG
jgi:hypothetical protein